MNSKAKLAIAIGIPLLCILFYMFNPAQTGFFPKCPMYVYTGLKCPGCGTQRAIHQLLHFNIAGAIHYNFLLVCSLPVIVFTVLAENFKEKFPKGHSIVASSTYTRTILVIVVLWGITRNIFNW